MEKVPDTFGYVRDWLPARNLGRRGGARGARAAADRDVLGDGLGGPASGAAVALHLDDALQGQSGGEEAQHPRQGERAR